MSDPASAERLDFILCQICPLFGADPCGNLFAHSLVGQANHLYICHIGMCIEEFLNLARINVLAAADDHVLDASGDAVPSVCGSRSEVPGVEPPIGRNCTSRL